jgi:hygromycin-B 4-O-kinase
MAETVNQEAVTRFIAERFGQSAGASVAVLGGGDWSRAFSFCVDDRGLVVRFGRYQEDFLKDQQAMRFARSELPIPKVLEIGEALGLFYAVSERHFGVFLETLDQDRWRRLMPALLRGLDALRKIEFEGGVDWSSASHDSPLGWRQWLLASLEDRPGERVSGWRATLHETPEIEQVFVAGESAMRARLYACPEVRHLLHRDLLNRNVLVAEDASRLEAVFDWGCSLAGDFLYEAAWLTFWAPWYPALQALDFRRVLREHYQRIGLVVEHFDVRLYCYELQIGLEHIAYATFTGREDHQQEIARRTHNLLQSAVAE